MQRIWRVSAKTSRIRRQASASATYEHISTGLTKQESFQRRETIDSILAVEITAIDLGPTKSDDGPSKPSVVPDID